MRGFYVFVLILFAVFAYYTYSTYSQDDQTATTTTTAKPAGRTVVLETEKGRIKIRLFEEDMPLTARNFIELVQTGFYTNLTFHRVDPGFVIQTGDPTGTGRVGSGKAIPLEISEKHNNVRGGVGMARSMERDSATSQFYILMKDSPHLDGGYAVFGEVTEGMDVVERISIGDRLVKAALE